MNGIFEKLYSGYIKEIHNFLDSEADFLYINGYSGSGKSSVLKKAIQLYEKEVLNFQYICFKNTTTDDFLLSFYDSFREHTLNGKIELKSNPEQGIMEKVNFYFASLNLPALVVIDNFELIPDNSEVYDFLLHISRLKNVKVVVISKNPTCSIAENPTIGVQTLVFEKIKKDDFLNVLNPYLKDEEKEFSPVLYDLCEGYELYIKMTLTYITTLNISLKDLIEEFNKRNVEFRDFIMERQIALIPENYYPVLENFACFNHNISPKFITTYEIGDIKQISYLVSKYALSEFFGTFYIKSYLRKHFINILGIQDKVSLYSKILSIYEDELKKGLKDRLLRLSRENIRKQIADIEADIPKVEKIVSTPSFSYVTQAINSNPQWFITESANKPMSALDKLRKKRDERNKEKENEIKEEEIKNSQFEEKLQKAVSLEEEYKYKDAINLLIDEVKPLIKDFNDKRKVYVKIAKNAIKINDNNLALTHLREIAENANEKHDINLFAKCRIEIGKLYKKMFALQRAKDCLNELIKKQDEIDAENVAYAKMILAEIYELENNYDSALEAYKEAKELVSDMSSPKLAEISYRIASIYDEEELYEEAEGEYKESLEYAKTSGYDKYLLKTYSNLGTILSYEGKTQEAVENLLEAFELSKDSDNYIDTYYIARSLASVYMNFDSAKAYEYLLIALDYAKYSGNSFEIAISLLELGDYYYNTMQNEQALISYFQAKNMLGDSASKENMDRITTRINDMRVKLGDYIFNGMKELYDTN